MSWGVAVQPAGAAPGEAQHVPQGRGGVIAESCWRGWPPGPCAPPPKTPPVTTPVLASPGTVLSAIVFVMIQLNFSLFPEWPQTWCGASVSEVGACVGSSATGVAWLPRRRALRAPAVLQALPASCEEGGGG